jgi:hypothetical protein
MKSFQLLTFLMMRNFQIYPIIFKSLCMNIIITVKKIYRLENTIFSWIILISLKQQISYHILN